MKSISVLKTTTIILLISTLIYILSQSKYEISFGKKNDNILSPNSFIDLSGNLIEVNKSINRIISLSPVHTENIFFIGGGDQIIGVDNDSNFPYQTSLLEKYNLKKIFDINKIIENRPDFVLIDPDINTKHRTLVSMLEANKINVVNLKPDNLHQFDSYIKKLGIITNCSSKAETLLFRFKQELIGYGIIKSTNPKTVFVELSEKGYITATESSLIGQVFSLAGTRLLKPLNNLTFVNDETIKVGEDFILENDDKIDTYFSVTGSGFSGANKFSVNQKEGFRDLKSIKDCKFYEIPSVFISNYTFRLIDGIREIHRLVYGDKMEMDLEKPLTRIIFANILYQNLLLPTYTITKPNYYEHIKYGHIYGSYSDVLFNDPDFNIVETVSMLAYLLPLKDSNGFEYFDKYKLVSLVDLYQFLFLYNNMNKFEVEELLKELNINPGEMRGMDFLNLLKFIKGDVK